MLCDVSCKILACCSLALFALQAVCLGKSLSHHAMLAAQSKATRSRACHSYTRQNGQQHHLSAASCIAGSSHCFAVLASQQYFISRSQFCRKAQLPSGAAPDRAPSSFLTRYRALCTLSNQWALNFRTVSSQMMSAYWRPRGFQTTGRRNLLARDPEVVMRLSLALSTL